MSGSPVKNENPVGWFEIYVDDMHRARTFCETVFGYVLTLHAIPDQLLAW